MLTMRLRDLLLKLIRSDKLSFVFFFFFSSRRRHTRFDCDWSSDVCSSDLYPCCEVRATDRLSSEVLVQRFSSSPVTIDANFSLTKEHAYHCKPLLNIIQIGRASCRERV